MKNVTIRSMAEQICLSKKWRFDALNFVMSVESCFLYHHG